MGEFDDTVALAWRMESAARDIVWHRTAEDRNVLRPGLGTPWDALHWRSLAPLRFHDLFPRAGVDAVLPPMVRERSEFDSDFSAYTLLGDGASLRRVAQVALARVKQVASLELVARSHDRWAGRGATSAVEARVSRRTAEGLRVEAAEGAAALADLGENWMRELSVKPAVAGTTGKW